ncbi:hypothetical protein ACFVDT_03695 [Streptomyces sp. NPDC057699]|uniref:hypothetical protein n=1 Tax=Streptomyces sp. NPDC057699 TaxID=3346220 RepID=UPI0036799C24
MKEASWYGVRSVFRHHLLEVYEERITLWRAQSLDEAIERAEVEALEYCLHLDEVEYVRFSEAYGFDDALEDGVEVFSLMRGSRLPPGQYIERFFATGSESTGFIQ